jgi:hypothetical protein
MGVDVHEPRSDDAASGVDGTVGGARVPHDYDLALGDADVGAVTGSSGSVDHDAVANYQVEHIDTLSGMAQPAEGPNRRESAEHYALGPY